MANGIRLNSPAPLDDGGRKYNKLYIICGIIGFIIYLFSSHIAGALIVIVGFMELIAWLIKNVILEAKGKNLRSLRFALDKAIPYEELIEKLIPQIVPLGMRIEKDRNGCPVITYKNLIYDISYNNDYTFTIWWRKSIIRAMFTGPSITEYRNHVVAYGMIGYYIQQACK